MRLVFFVFDLVLIAVVVGALYLSYQEGKNSKKKK